MASNATRKKGLSRPTITALEDHTARFCVPRTYWHSLLLVLASYLFSLPIVLKHHRFVGLVRSEAAAARSIAPPRAARRPQAQSSQHVKAQHVAVAHTSAYGLLGSLFLKLFSSILKFVFALRLSKALPHLSSQKPKPVPNLISSLSVTTDANPTR